MPIQSPRHTQGIILSCLSTFANSDIWSQLSSFFSGDDNLPLFCLISFPSAHTTSCRQESHVDNFFPTLRSVIRQSESLRMSSSVIQKPWTVLVAEIVMKDWYYNLKIRSNGHCPFEGGIPRPNGLARMDCALFSSNRQCRKTSKQEYPFANLRIVYLMHILITGRMQTLCSCFWCHARKEKIGSDKSALLRLLTGLGLSETWAERSIWS